MSGVVDRCPSVDPYGGDLQCGRPVHEDDQCQLGGIAWKKGTPQVRRTIRPRFGDLEAATQPHTAVPSGEFAGPVEVCDLCGLAMTNSLMHPEATS